MSPSNEHVSRPPAGWDDAWQGLSRGDTASLCWLPAENRLLRQAETDRRRQQTQWLLPGSFNPLHQGHLQMVQWVERQRGADPAYELSTENVDKPSLSSAEAWRRVAQFRPPQVVWLTRAATFVEKAKLFGPVTFLVGADTIQRVAAANYYRGGPAGRRQALATLQAQQIRFLVFGRLIQRGAAEHLFVGEPDACALPDELAARCEWVPPAEFRVDVSSSQLRRRNA